MIGLLCSRWVGFRVMRLNEGVVKVVFLLMLHVLIIGG